MAQQTGIFNINNGNPAELNMRSFAGQILRRFPNGSAPMYALTALTGRSKAKQSTHGYFTKVMSFLRVLNNGAGNAGDTSLVWPSTAGVTAGMLFHNMTTGENVRVTAIPDATHVTVTRGFGRIAAAAITDQDIWINVGTAFEEGSNRPTSRRLTTTYVPNYTQIFRNAWAMTDTARASYAEMGISNISENRQDCAMFHSVDLETAIIWGQPMMDTTGATPVHATQGVLDALAQYAPGNIQIAASTTNYDQLVAMLEPIFQYSANLGDPKTRVAFADSQALRTLNQIGRASGVIEITQNETQFGMAFTSFKFYKGTVNLVEHPLMNGLQQQGSLLVMDMAALKLAYLDGRDTKSEDYGNGKSPDNGQDAVGGSLTTECAVELINPFSCGYVTGLTQGVA